MKIIWDERFNGVWGVLTLVTVCFGAREPRCDRKPFHTTHAPSDSSGHFELVVSQITSGMFLPDQQYEVTLQSLESHSFAAFMVWPEGEDQPDPRNPHKTVSRDPGIMRIYANEPVKLSDRCVNTVEKINAAQTSEVKMYWKSPKRGNGCVTLHAMVAENDEVWYLDGDGLTIRLCEDDTFMEDKPPINDKCAVCEDAKYEITFEGKWSRNTHPHKFPANEWSVYYGDLIGASHSQEYSMWKDGSPASEAMKRLALENNTMDIELEILTNYTLGYVRTLIKGKGHGPLNGDLSDPTHALVRVDRKHHFISTVTALKPSPDWYLGVSEYELCQEDNTWLPNKTIDLIPWDAGVSKGISFESPYDPSNELIGRVRVGSFDPESPFYNMNYRQIKPFATLTIQLIRTYPRTCEDLNTEDGEQDVTETGNEPVVDQPEAPSRRTSPPPQSEEKPEEGEETNVPGDTISNDLCPVSDWEEWTPCSSPCGESGYRSRSRHHVVNGVEFRYYKPGEIIPSGISEPSEECSRRHKDDMLMTEPCEGFCPSEPQLLAYRAEDSSIRSRRISLRGSGNDGRDSRMAGSVHSESDQQQDCVMSSWTRWAACSVSCGEGRQLRARTLIREARNGGQPCPTTKLEVKKCSLDPCVL